jgi:hypothetical protein
MEENVISKESLEKYAAKLYTVRDWLETWGFRGDEDLGMDWTDLGLAVVKESLPTVFVTAGNQ